MSTILVTGKYLLGTNIIKWWTQLALQRPQCVNGDYNYVV